MTEAFNPVTGQVYKGKQGQELGMLIAAGLSGQFAGFKQWLEAGRVVKKGEKGIKILLPIHKRDETGKEDTRFKSVTVFAIEQTTELQKQAA